MTNETMGWSPEGSQHNGDGVGEQVPLRPAGVGDENADLFYSTESHGLKMELPKKNSELDDDQLHRRMGLVVEYSRRATDTIADLNTLLEAETDPTKIEMLLSKLLSKTSDLKEGYERELMGLVVE
jgi:hypothetical protein